MKVQSVLVAGAGQMGAGIVQVAAAGRPAGDHDRRRRRVHRQGHGRHREAASARAVEKGRLDAAERDAALARITTGLDMAAGADADLFIEAAPESLDIKRDLLERAAAAAAARRPHRHATPRACR